MRFDEIERIHEALGDEYLETMLALGVTYPPPVLWRTEPPFPSGRTIAVVYLDDDEAEIAVTPRDVLVSAVVRRALAGCHFTSEN